MQIHLVDGTYELFRAYYGAPAAKAADGAEVGATRGFLRSLLALLSEAGVTHIACAFDHVIESFRNELFEGYKTGDGIEPELFAQFGLAERASAALGVVTWPMVEFETDDALATAAARFAGDEAVEQVVICSPDKDFAQCVSGDRVVLWDRMRGKIYDEAGVIEKWGVAPASIPDWLALVGDSADGIPGVPRWGAKSAAKVLSTYGRVEDIPAREDSWTTDVRGKASLAENLRQHREVLQLYKTLATLRTDVPLRESLDDLMWRGADETLLQSLLSDIDYPQLSDRIPRWR